MASEMSLEEKKKMLKTLTNKINKDYGEGTTKKASDLAKIEGIPTGMISLDVKLGCFGMPKGRIVEIFGKEHSGKTSLALECIANTHKLSDSSYSAYFDLENGLDRNYCKSIGVDLDRLQVVEPIPAEDVCTTIRDFINSGIFDYIVVDSTSAMSPTIEQNKKIDVNAQVAGTAKLLSSLCRQIVGPLGRTNTCLIFISQIRKKVGASMYENPDVVGHGEALKFFSSIRISVLKQKEEEGSEDCPRNPTTYTIIKNKCGGKPKSKVEEVIEFGSGIDKESDVLIFCLKSGVITRGGAIYTYIDDDGKEHKWKGKNEVKKELKENSNLKNEIVNKSISAMIYKEENRSESEEDEDGVASTLEDEEEFNLN